ncbi:tetratricopeptide repeat protein [Nodosilinea nodulosa]|uniref:tetratricopeptide repeat protein n=1 Tax=Nodosilinea nodulosa TaxID=416001 RepID=UPI000303E4A8|nr:tetratricopeptide repeat protein [Nodosilinea nodulosa]
MEISVRERQILPTGLRPSQRPPRQARRFEVLRHGEMGKLLLEKGRYQEALVQVEQALALNPHDAESWCSRADVLGCLGRYEEALQSLEQAQELAGFASARLWVQKAVLLILLNRPKLALTCCNQALWRSPSHTQAWLFRGVALHGLGRFKAAYRSYQRVLEPAAPSSANSIRKLCHDLTIDHQAS